MAARQYNPDNIPLPPVESRLQLSGALPVRRHIRTALRSAGSFLFGFRAFLMSRAADTSDISCVDPAEAYLRACVAAPFFCYVSPSLYGLTGVLDEQGVTRSARRPRDEA